MPCGGHGVLGQDEGTAGVVDLLRELFDGGASLGVAGDVRNNGMQQEARPQIYVPYTQNGFRPGTILVRTSVDPLSLQRNVLEQVWAVDSGVALMNVRSLDQVLHRAALAGPRDDRARISAFRRAAERQQRPECGFGRRAGG